MKQHSSSALEVAKFLENHPKVKKVNYPLLESNSNYENATKYLNGGASGLISFEATSYDEAVRILDNIKLFTIVANIGDSKSLIIHPASTTHQQLNEAELKAAGVDKALVRLSIGLENTQDLINALDEVL
jgi:O-acetylhomoserine (thiol)-lyase